MLRPGDAFVRTIAGGRHAVWLPEDDSRGAFAHTVGLAYLHDLPEILLLSPMPAMIGATSRALALTVNAIADAMIGGVALKPGDRYAVVAGTVARTVHKECTLDQARPGAVLLRRSGAAHPGAHAGRRRLVLRELHGRDVVSGARLPAAAAAHSGRLRRAAAPAAREDEARRSEDGRAASEGQARRGAEGESEAKRAPVKKPAAKKPARSRRGNRARCAPGASDVLIAIE